MKQARSGFWPVLAFLACAAAGRAGAAEVAVLKSNEVAAWRPTMDALRRAAGSHNLTEYDLRGDRTEGERVLGVSRARR